MRKKYMKIAERDKFIVACTKYVFLEYIKNQLKCRQN